MYRWIAAVLLLVSACSSSDSVAHLLPFMYDQNEQFQGTLGTAHDDVWHITAYGKMGQDDPFELRVQHWNGTTVTTVPLADEIFREGSCGRPSAMAAVSRGEIWLGSFHVPNCGFSTVPTNTKLIFGRLKIDGTWEDHSADFPVGPQGTYKAIDLTGRDGVVYASVTYNPGPSTYKLFRYAADGTFAEVPYPPGGTGIVQAIGADEVLLSDTVTTMWLYRSGSWQSIPFPKFNLATHHINTGGERWSMGGTVDQSTTATAYRYAEGVFTEVTINTAGTPFSNMYRPLVIIPRGNGRMTWLFVQFDVALGGLTIHKREFDGTTLGNPSQISSSSSCSGTSEQCLARSAEVSVLHDGSALVGHLGNIWRFVVPIDEVR